MGGRPGRATGGLSPDLLVADVLSRWPQTLTVFTRNRMACPGCTMGCFETLAEAASVYGLRPDRFLEELRASLPAKVPAEAEGMGTRRPEMESFAVREALRAVLDPEVGINIVDLGLVYRAEESEGRIRVEMTMTSPACPVGNLLRTEAEDALRGRFPEAQEVRVELVWSPPWHPGMMSPAGRQQLGLET